MCLARIKSVIKSLNSRVNCLHFIRDHFVIWMGPFYRTHDLLKNASLFQPPAEAAATTPINSNEKIAIINEVKAHHIFRNHDR